MIYVNAPDRQVIEITNAIDEPVYNGMDEKGNPKPVRHTYQQFLLARTADEAFAEFSPKLEGFDLLERLQLARKQIKATATAPGPHGFDSEIAKRLQAAILKPKGGRISTPEFEHNWYEWAKNWQTLSEAPAVMVAEEANG